MRGIAKNECEGGVASRIASRVQLSNPKPVKGILHQCLAPQKGWRAKLLDIMQCATSMRCRPTWAGWSRGMDVSHAAPAITEC